LPKRNAQGVSWLSVKRKHYFEKQKHYFCRRWLNARNTMSAFGKIAFRRNARHASMVQPTCSGHHGMPPFDLAAEVANETANS